MADYFHSLRRRNSLLASMAALYWPQGKCQVTFSLHLVTSLLYVEIAPMAPTTARTVLARWSRLCQATPLSRCRRIRPIVAIATAYSTRSAPVPVTKAPKAHRARVTRRRSPRRWKATRVAPERDTAQQRAPQLARSSRGEGGAQETAKAKKASILDAAILVLRETGQ